MGKPHSAMSQDSSISWKRGGRRLSTTNGCKAERYGQLKDLLCFAFLCVVVGLYICCKFGFGQHAIFIISSKETSVFARYVWCS